MHAFHLERKMVSFLGDFYPTGHLFVMFRTEAHARRAEKLLQEAGHDCEQDCLLKPQDVLDVVHLFDHRDLWWPAVGTEERTARHIGELAKQGHHALLVPVRNVQECERVMAALKDADVTCAVRYRRFVIEDIVT
jgi:hypothetical protein